MSINSYFRVKDKAENLVVIERSRFISRAKKCETEEEARRFLDEIRKANPFATHNCYAYVTDKGEISRFSDDGEPQGTAGQPILEVIKNKKLRDTAVVVTRYFGGIKLGAGGLVRAYSQCAKEVLEKAQIEENVLSNVWNIDFSYDLYSSFLKFASKRKTKIEDVEYSDGVRVVVAVPIDDDKFGADLADFALGKVKAEAFEQKYVAYGEEKK